MSLFLALPQRLKPLQGSGLLITTKFPEIPGKFPRNFILCSTVSVVGFEQVNADRLEVCHTFHISTICKKALNDSHMLNQECNFIFREKDGGKILHLG